LKATDASHRTADSLHSVADIVQCGPGHRKGLTAKRLGDRRKLCPHKLLILLILQGWLAALDDFRNWLIREAA
jgi:hypothetical protein